MRSEVSCVVANRTHRKNHPGTRHGRSRAGGRAGSSCDAGEGNCVAAAVGRGGWARQGATRRMGTVGRDERAAGLGITRA
eukprot:3247159-Prymnesium_polylepis.1